MCSSQMLIYAPLLPPTFPAPTALKPQWGLPLLSVPSRVEAKSQSNEDRDIKGSENTARAQVTAI